MIVFIALGGVVGTLARYFVGAWLQGPHVAFPRGTLAINISGIVHPRLRDAPCHGNDAHQSLVARGALTIGFCGAFTTMSSFSYETVALATEGDLWRAGLYAGSTIAGCLCATVAGIALATKLL